MFFVYEKVKIHYIYEEGFGTPVLFLHGWGGSVDSFAGAANALRATRRPLVRLDFMGFGQSEESKTSWQLEDYASCTLALLAHLKLSRVILVAHSFGARVASLIVAKQPHLVGGAVLCGAAGLSPRRGLKYHLRVFAYKRAKARGGDLTKFGSSDYRQLSPIMRQTFVKIVNFDTKDYLSQIKCDTILVWGDRDDQTPMYMARKMSKLIKNSALIVFRGCGHFAYVEEGGRFNRILASFVDSLEQKKQ